MLADTVDHPGGIGRYVRELLGAFGRRTDVRLTVVIPETARDHVHDLVGRSLDHVIVPPRTDQIALALWERYRAGPAFVRGGAEVIIGCKHLVPRTRRPTVLVVHDVLTITRAHENAFAKRILLPAQYRRSLSDASRLVAVSAATKTRLGALDPRWESKCDVIQNGMSADLLGAIAEPFPSLVDRPFALAVGDLSPRKNLTLLTRLWAERPPADLALAVVGPDSHSDTAIRRELLDLERDGRVVWIRDANDSVLRWCYEHASVVVLPTFEEGFGLPLLEAMTFHAPVVASVDLALREVAGASTEVEHVDPNATARWRDAIVAAAGRARTGGTPTLPAGALTWDDHTDQLVAVVRSLCRGSAG